MQLLGKQCRQASFISELAMMFTQFRRSGIPPEQLYNSSAELNGRLQEKMLDVFEIYQRYDQLLEQHQLKDTETDLSEAAAIANGHDAFLGDVIFLDEFESFTEDEYQVLSVLLSSGKDLYIALRMEHTRKEPFSLFAAVQETFCKIQDMAKKLRIPVETEVCDTPYRFQAAELSWLNQHVFRNTQPFSGEAPHLHILEAQSPTEEVDYVCATIRRLLAKDHTLRCRDIAVLSNQMTDYRSILETAMERYKLPYYMDEKESMLYTPLLVYLHTLLGILRQTRPDTELLMRLGKTGLTSCSVKKFPIWKTTAICGKSTENVEYALYCGEFCISRSGSSEIIDPVAGTAGKTERAAYRCGILQHAVPVPDRTAGGGAVKPSAESDCR